MKHNTPQITAWLTLGLLFGLTATAIAIKCPNALSDIDREQKAHDELLKLLEEMTREFEGVLQKDFQLMSEGSRDSSHRGTAVKLAHSKNRLNKKIDDAEKKINEMTINFCKYCAPDKKATAQLTKFCEFCEDASRCPEDRE